MSAQEIIENIARATVMSEPSDLTGLVAVQGKLEELQGVLEEAEFARIESVVHASIELVGQIVMRETESPDETFNELQQQIASIQKLLTEEPDEPVSTPPAGESGPPATADGCDEEMLQAWVSNCEMSLSDLEVNVLTIEADDESDPAEAIAEARRAIHTLKGECGVLSLHDAQSLCHEAESLIDERTMNEQPFPADEVLALIDWLKEYAGAIGEGNRDAVPDHQQLLARLQSVKEGEPAAGSAAAPIADTAPGEVADAASPATADDAPPCVTDAVPVTNESSAPAEAETTSSPNEAMSTEDTAPVTFGDDIPEDDNLQEFMCEAKEHLASAEQAVLELEDNLEDKELINTVFRAFHTIKGVAGFMSLTPIVELAHNAEYLLDAARYDKIQLNSTLLDLVLNSCDMLTQFIGLLEGGPAPQRSRFEQLKKQLEAASRGDDVGPVSRDAAEPAPSPSTQENVDAASTSETDLPADTTEPSDPDSDKAEKTRAKLMSRKADQTVKVSTGRMDNLVTMVGELVIAQQMVVQDAERNAEENERLQRHLAHTTKIIRDLQEVSMSLRMVSVRSTFQKMARLVRDVSNRAGKKIRFSTEGDDVELDRNVVEEIADPLVHMVRNACDHGVEPGEERVQIGKPEEGRVTLRAYHSGGSIVIEIEDDGRGLDREKILTKAIDKGIFPQDRKPEDMSDSDVFNMIFMPGFSTAEQVTDISGRGVGMDVVRRNIESLRGKVEIRSVLGKGTVFMMRLPLTMAIIDGMIIRVGAQRYVVPTLSIEHSFRPGEKEIKTIIGRGEMINVRGSILPVYRLNKILGLNEGETDPANALLLILEFNNKRCALMVDEIIGQQQIVIKNLGEGIGSIRGVSGGAILGDGRVALILDVGGLLAQATSDIA
ncbi:MAG: chemotaxis protein CheA [Phycisphaerales bacterium]|nr:MAG: chemotaxis protein CheA [Phycisphaerales bacterium]